MVRTMFLTLFSIWLMGLVSGYTLGNSIKILLVAPLLVVLVVPLIMLVYSVVTGRKAQP